MSRKYRDRAPDRQSSGHPEMQVVRDAEGLWWLHILSENKQSASINLGVSRKAPITEAVLESVRGLRFVPEIEL